MSEHIHTPSAPAKAALYSAESDAPPALLTSALPRSPGATYIKPIDTPRRPLLPNVNVTVGAIVMARVLDLTATYSGLVAFEKHLRSPQGQSGIAQDSQDSQNSAGPESR